VKTGQSKAKNTRETILNTIKVLHESTIENLADAAGVSPVTVRHHINTLLADGTIESRSVRRKVGRPHYVYSLSKAGEELFPQKYFRLSNLLLEEIKARLAPEEVVEIFHSVVQRIVDEHESQYKELPFEERLDYVVQLLGQEGFMAKWERKPDGYRLIEYSCPYISIGETHTEICEFDKGLILSVLNTDIEQHSCMLAGDRCCEFAIAAPVSIN